ncbi:MAG TPA: CBS domain-containing protein [candidate division Zixibacteria bacterium]|nr:CBS domain-containing protein [candidate division Zixibacteria bacterium]
MSGARVRDWMHAGVETCGLETPIERVAAVMDAKDISALIVTDAQGDVAGVISRTDLVNARFVQPYLKHWRGMTAEHLMTKPAITIGPDATIEEAARVLADRRIHRLVVVEESSGHVRAIGVLSVTDLARRVAEE